MRGGPAILVRVGLLLVLVTAAIGTSADADLWGHLRFGQDILRTGTIVQADEYSFTSDRPWINHEWLSEVAFAGAYELLGASGLIALKVLVISAVLTLVWWRVRSSDRWPTSTLWIVVLAFAGTYWRTHSVRPQLFSVLLFAGLLVLIARADDGRRRGLAMLPLLFALWVNLHGGWIVGLGVLGFWVAVRLVDRGLAPRARIGIAVAGLASVVATLLNPYGLDLWRFIGETVRLQRNDIEDWNSVLADPIRLGVPWAVCAASAAWFVVRGGWPRRKEYLVIVGLAALVSLRVGRLDAFFCLAIVLLLAPQWVAKPIPSRKADEPVAAGPAYGPLVITAVVIAAMVVPAARIVRPLATCVPIGGAWAPDADAARFIAANHLRGRMLTWFDWGQYAIWHFGPALQVSMDGRRETVYLDRTIQAHRAFYAADASAEAYLRALNPDYIWVANRLPIAGALTDRAWVAIFSSPVSRVFARAGSGPFQAIAAAAPGPRCFPGP